MIVAVIGALVDIAVDGLFDQPLLGQDGIGREVDIDKPLEH